MTRKQKRVFIRILVSAVLLIAAWLLPFQGMARLAAFLVCYGIIGWDVLWSAARNIVHGQVFDERLLMTIATFGAFGTGEYPEAVAVMLFYQIGELFQDFAVGRSRKSIAALMDLRPDHANVLRDGTEQCVAPEDVAAGELLIIRPGERIPLDGVILSGTTSVNTSALTGESLPRDLTVGDTVVSGTVNLTGAITVQVSHVYAESTAAKILELVEGAAAKKARAERFITRFARYYTPCVVAAAVLLAVLPPLLFGQPFSRWFERALVFLVVSCPCALVISIPLTFFGGIGGASRSGILIKGAGFLETLSKIDTIVFDKTGTLTRGSFAVVGICAEQISEAELLKLAATAEQFSNHPIAESVVAAYGAPVARERVSDLREHAGMGIEAVIDGTHVYVGNEALMKLAGAAWHGCASTGTILHISRGGLYLGHIVVSDEIKPDAAGALAALRQLGITRTVMLTGDRADVADAVASRLNITQTCAQLLPAGKVEAVEALLEKGARLAFVGDGVNDAPVLSRADVGIAMGALGSDAAIEAADVVLLDDNLFKLPLAIRIARRTMRIVRQNLIFALAVKAIVLILSAVGAASMWSAVFADVGVMVLAILNAMRALQPLAEQTSPAQ